MTTPQGFFFFSVDLDDDDDPPALSPELLEALNLYLSRQLRRKDSSAFSLDSISPVVRDFLAAQRLKELFPAEPVPNGVRIVVCVELLYAISFCKRVPFLQANEVRVRATLVPLQFGRGIRSRRKPFSMRYRTLNIGFGSAANQLDLSEFGHCNFVSSKHAAIYFDQHSQVSLHQAKEGGTSILLASGMRASSNIV